MNAPELAVAGSGVGHARDSKSTQPFSERKKMNEATAIPDIGVHDSVPFETYHRWNLASNSRLTDMMRSPAYCKYRMTTDREETDALKLGSAAHCAILEPDALEKRYAVAGPCQATLKNGAPCGVVGSIPTGGKWFCRRKGHAPDNIEQDDVIVLSPGMWDAALGIRDSVQRNPAAKALLDRQVRREVSCVWKDEDTGLLCKARPDILAHDLIGDVKTTVNAAPAEFEKHVANYGIHRQAALYMAGMRALDRKVDAFVVIAVQSDPPHESAVYALDPQAIRIGEIQVSRLLYQYKICVEESRWPGFMEGVIPATLPAWYQKQHAPELFQEAME